MPSQRDRFIAACEMLAAIQRETGMEFLSISPERRVYVKETMSDTPAEAWDEFMADRAAAKAWDEWSYT